MPTPRIIVTGAGGRLGAALVREWKSVGMEVIGFGRQELDLAQPEQMRRALNAIDSSKTQKELGWMPKHRPAQGIRETIAWYVANRAWWEPLRKKS